MSGRPLVVAANRLPISKAPDGRWVTSPGGLVRALLPTMAERHGIWVGWSGSPVEHDTRTPDDTALDGTAIDDLIDATAIDGIRLCSVAIDDHEARHYYEGFSNDTLWPLYHDAIRESGYHGDDWDAYRTVNARFADRIAEVAPDDAVVWVHDYHLQLVPAMLRARRPDVRIGWFDHIPFPPLELFQRLPWREEIVEGLLGADLLGFQRVRGARNFVGIARHLVGAEEVEPGILDHDGHRIAVGNFPISIDVAEFESLASGRSVRRRASEIRTALGEPEVILLGVDRLDYTKGIGSRLRAFGALLDEGRLDPAHHVLVQVATPTREGVELYQEERREIEQIVGEINGRHARLGFPVVHYLFRLLPLDELIPLYRAGDVMLVTPFRDGMNLVAKEYVASHVDGDGVLVLSEFTGASDELVDAILVNPHDERALQDAIVRAVDMHRHERRPRMESMRATLATADVGVWADSFLTALDP